MKRNILFILLILGILGIIDAGYLTFEHYNNILPPCTINHFLPILTDCGKVLTSSYSLIFGIPLALLGIIHYSFVALSLILAIRFKNKLYSIWTLMQSVLGAIASLYFMYLQLFVIKSICTYCTVSAFISFAIFILAFFYLEKERKTLFIYKLGILYRFILKPIFFLINPEIVHVVMVGFGSLLGNCPCMKKILPFFFNITHKSLEQKIAGIQFKNPVGLAAGFDYHANLTQILPLINFGFGSVGTITNLSYEGNPPPLLGRLPKSKSLMVNKGYKNLGAVKTIEKLEKLQFRYPVGISIGRTNSKKQISQKQSVEDVVQTFKKFESSKVLNEYYELNISCPNLFGNISFYPPKNLNELLTAVSKLTITKPVFIKMPIEKTNKEFLEILNVISKFSFVTGIIVGNLQKNRKDLSFDPSEIIKFKVGNFSGKPCEKRSNELIELAYRSYKKRFVIIGCGGVFSAKDAYEKIKKGATLVQLITGMIFQGPQLVAQINLELIELLKKDNYKNIKDAIGSINI
ncbi:MAG: quinone-dependent dihydroorotate dehydrogenase [bacterium]|nr:quinone-dependent dihydroorotate dehydrogenase [bacterium]